MRPRPCPGFGEACCVVALAVTSDGTTVPVGLWLGDTENTTVVTARLAHLVERGLDASGGLLVVIDGAKALAAGVRKVFGDQTLVQRCTFHKRRNIADHLPTDQAPWVDRKLPRRSRTRMRTRAARREGPRSQPPPRASRRGRIVAGGPR
jgi:transposase-like protein